MILKYTAEQYKEMAKRFNSLKTEGKLLLIRMHPDIFRLECDDGYCLLRLQDSDAMINELDMLFEIDNFLEEKDLEGITIHKLRI